MPIAIYQVDAFSSEIFHGNPAAVCPLDAWLDDATLQAIAAENNLSETSFFVATGNGYQLRWFTPAHEVKLCGHATLASAYVLYERLGYTESSIHFETLSGQLMISRQGDRYTMDFPAQTPVPCEPPALLAAALGETPIAVLKTDDYIAVFESEASIQNLQPDLGLLKQIECRGVTVTAPGSEADFVSRFFAPRYGIDEDPVTGSAHCDLVPYWHQRLGKTRFRAQQLSQRGGVIDCELSGSRVLLSGQAALYLEGQITIR